MTAGREFSDLNIWQKGYELVLEVYRVTSNYPREEKYDLTSQTRRASNSIIANIAEAHGRFYYADKIRVLYQARGETIEIRSHLRVAFGLGLLDDATFQKLDRSYEGLGAGINAYINSIQHSAKRP